MLKKGDLVKIKQMNQMASIINTYIKNDNGQNQEYYDVSWYDYITKRYQVKTCLPNELITSP